MAYLTTIKCPFCSKQLHPRTVAISGTRLFAGYEICQCEGAKQAQHQKEKAEKTEAQEVERTRKFKSYQRAGIKPRFQDTLPYGLDAKAREVLETIENGNSAYLCGSVGTGKSTIASWVAMRCIDKKMSAKVTDALGIVGAFYATYSGEGTEESVLQSLSSCDLLVIDDLGKEPPQYRPVSQIYRVINDRYEHMKPVIVTSQFSRNSLLKRLAQSGDKETAQAIVSRLYQMCKVFNFNGKDWRLVKEVNQ